MTYTFGIWCWYELPHKDMAYQRCNILLFYSNSFTVSHTSLSWLTGKGIEHWSHTSFGFLISHIIALAVLVHALLCVCLGTCWVSHFTPPKAFSQASNVTGANCCFHVEQNCNRKSNTAFVLRYADLACPLASHITVNILFTDRWNKLHEVLIMHILLTSLKYHLLHLSCPFYSNILYIKSSIISSTFKNFLDSCIHVVSYHIPVLCFWVHS